MKNIRKSAFRVIALLFILLTGLACTRISQANDTTSKVWLEGEIIHVPTGIKITEKELIDIVHNSKVVYIGETHDNYDSHKVQLRIIKSIYQVSGGHIAIGMEMFQRPSQSGLDLWLADQITEKDFLKNIWYPNWGYEYEYYREIVEFAKDNKVPIVALNADYGLVKKIQREGLDKLTDEEKKTIPEIDTQDKDHRTFVKAVYDVHGKEISDGFEPFYFVQCLWDETMAQSAVDYLKGEGGDRLLIVLAGQDHVRYGLGIPKRVFRRMHKSYAIILPVELSIPENKSHNIMDVKEVKIPLHEADFLWMVNYTDPVIDKVRLGVMVIKAERGVIVHQIEEDSSAREAGLKKGDIILSVDDVSIDEPFDLVYEIRSKSPGKSGKIKIIRDGKEQIVEIKYRKESGKDKG